MTPLLSCADDLDATREEVWAMLARGVTDRTAPARTPTLGTIDRLGGPALRTVVLRDCVPAERRLTIHTDGRTAKVGELAADPRAALHVYDPRLEIQLRLGGEIVTHRGDALAARAWGRVPASARASYRMTPPPGTPIATPSDAAPDASDDAAAAHFTVLALVVARIDWVYLAADRHRRAAFDWDGARWRGTWLAP